jgi:F0F1-type ATP synthase membrane subunit c/vacuolar-type H+-ATPase subunit K
MIVMGKKPEMASFYLTVTILGIALVESAVIYGLVVAFQLLSAEGIGLLSSIGAGSAIGLAGLGAGIGEGMLIS